METKQGPVDLAPAERAQKVLLRPGGNSGGEGDEVCHDAAFRLSPSPLPEEERDYVSKLYTDG